MNEFTKTKNVILIGASGLVGSNLLELLKADVSIGKIFVLSRNPSDSESSKKVEVHGVDFDNLDTVKHLFHEADSLFCCMGTTKKKAGSTEEFLKVDYEIPLKLAKLASKHSIKRFIVISSAGANPDSLNFYLKTKGEMEKEIASYSFQKLAFVRPSLILGRRKHLAFKEGAGQVLMFLFSFLFVGPFEKFKPLGVSIIAKAMFSISHSLNNQRIYEFHDLVWLGR